MRDERGAVLLLVALSVGGLLAMVALVVDLAVLYTARAEAQRAADAAALAGASAYRDYDPLLHPVAADELARRLAYEYALRNSIRGTPIDSSDVMPEVLLADYKVRVTIRRSRVELGLARIFGIGELAVSARAAAIAADGNTTASCIKPFAIPDMWHEEDEDENDNWVMDFGVQRSGGGGGGFAGGNGQGSQNEVWSYDPADGDWYDPAVTGLGTARRNGRVDKEGRVYANDEGRRFPLKFQQPGQGGEPSNWGSIDLRPPGSTASAVAFYEQAIRGCVTPEHLVVSSRVEPLTGLAPNRTRWPIDDLVEQDPDAYWDHELGRVGYPRTSNSPYAPANTGNPESWRQSPRVITAVVVHPRDLDPGRHEMEVVNLVQLFLEDPAREYPGAGQDAPITGRLIRYASGGLTGGGGTGTLLKVPRLVE